VSYVKVKPVRPLALLLVALISAATPCLAAIPDARIPCTMAGCGDTQGASLDSVRPCCCASPAVPSSAGAAGILRTPVPTSILESPSIPVDTAAPIAALPGGDPGPAAHVPLFLLHASLLI